ncbi:hypothetical protein IX92_21470 [Vibrio coralliilyticus]|uniref:Uncharacterized protein n=1 Tax=Vibrio coralliilyticus TaxID=190893 RepID=A0AAN0SHT0_9VIBR|nr:hypothetical protein IX92_21470 [Vibrio coralliilyticus]
MVEYVAVAIEPLMKSSTGVIFQMMKEIPLWMRFKEAPQAIPARPVVNQPSVISARVKTPAGVFLSKNEIHLLSRQMNLACVESASTNCL